jgi:phosphatidylserine decarboxylase
MKNFSLFGTLSSVEIPYSFRKPILGWYVRTYGCDMDEAVNTSLTDYPTFAAFFNRPLKPRGRPISRSLLVRLKTHEN